MADSKFSEWSKGEQKRFEEITHKHLLQTYDNQFSSRAMFIRHLVFMNGGALVAILSSRAVLISNKANIEWTGWPMVFFTLGLILAALLNGMSYLRYVRSGLKESAIFDGLFQDEIGYQKYIKEISKHHDNEISYWRFEVFLGMVGLLCFIFGAISGLYHLL